MKVIFCSPFYQDKGYIQGGMSVWGANILNYYNNLCKSNIELLSVSFDRRSYIVNKRTSIFVRLFKGFNELSRPILKTWNLLRMRDIDVIHICTSGSLSLIKDYILVKLSKIYGAKSVVHFHMGRIPDILENSKWESVILNKVIKCANAIAVMDQSSYKALCDLGYKHVTNIPNPLSNETILAINKFKGEVSRNTNVVLYAGHVVKTKGVYELVKACSTLDGIELRIAGRCLDDVKFELFKIWGNQNSSKIIFLGELKHETVLKEMLSASCFVLPSYTEGFPNVILEAMACECPVIATDVGAISEMLNIHSENQCGLCVPIKAIGELRSGIYSIISDKNLANSLSFYAKLRVHECYSIERIWKILESIWINYKGDSPISFM